MIWKISTHNDSKYINIFIQADCLATMAGYCTNDDMQTMFADCFDSLMEECCGVMNDCDEQKTGFKKMCMEKGYPKLVNTGIELGIHIDPTCCHEAHELMVAAIEKYFPDVVRVEPIFDHEDMEEDHKNVLLATDDKGETALYIFMVEDCIHWYNLSFVGAFYLRDLGISCYGLGDALNEILDSYDSNDDILSTGNRPIGRKHTQTKGSTIDLDESWTAAGSIKMPCSTLVVEFSIFSLLQARIVMLECN